MRCPDCSAAGVVNSDVLRQAFCSGLVISSAFLLDIGIVYDS